LPQKDIISIGSPPIRGSVTFDGISYFSSGTYPIVIQPCENKLNPSNPVCNNAKPVTVGSVSELEMWYKQDIDNEKTIVIFVITSMSAVLSYRLTLSDDRKKSLAQNNQSTNHKCNCYR